MHAAAGTLHVDDPDNPCRNPLQAETAVCFKEHSPVCCQELVEKGVNPLLQQGLAAGYLHHDTGIRFQGGKDAGNGIGATFPLIGIAGVTVGAAQVATGKADKKTGIAGIGGLSLDAVKKLADF
jgi:hypothetical protein